MQAQRKQVHLYEQPTASVTGLPHTANPIPIPIPVPARYMVRDGEFLREEEEERKADNRDKNRQNNNQVVVVENTISSLPSPPSPQQIQIQTRPNLTAASLVALQRQLTSATHPLPLVRETRTRTETETGTVIKCTNAATCAGFEELGFLRRQALHCRQVQRAALFDRFANTLLGQLDVVPGFSSKGPDPGPAAALGEAAQKLERYRSLCHEKRQQGQQQQQGQQGQQGQQRHSRRRRRHHRRRRDHGGNNDNNNDNNMWGLELGIVERGPWFLGKTLDTILFENVAGGTYSWFGSLISVLDTRP